MTTMPNSFAERYHRGEAQIIKQVLPADLETPVSAAMKLMQRERYRFLLESVEGGAIRGRYSFLGWAPDLLWTCTDTRVSVAKAPFSPEPVFDSIDAPALASLAQTVEDAKIPHVDGIEAPIAGLVGNLGYDMVRLTEHLPNKPPSYTDLPDSILLRPTMLAVFDNVYDTLTLAAIVRPREGMSAQQAYDVAQVQIGKANTALKGAVPDLAEPAQGSPTSAPASNTKRETFLGMVKRAQDYIAAGDIFQVVLSQRFSMPFALSGFSLYRSLRRTNPAPFLFHIKFGNADLIGSSPEILVRVRKGEVTIRPIAGTRPRGIDAEQDDAFARDLLSDKKECAEHLMLLDLGRNDVGRVAVGGSVDVTQSYSIERYSHVMHIVSNVVGKLKQAVNPITALFAGFPAGTVSGAPKIRAMEIIDELEAQARGPYAGAVGYFGVDGDLDSCIVLRTALLHKGTLHIQAGAGIVADSVPEAEYEECKHKAKAIVTAATRAIAGFSAS